MEAVPNNVLEFLREQYPASDRSFCILSFILLKSLLINKSYWSIIMFLFSYCIICSLYSKRIYMLEFIIIRYAYLLYRKTIHF